MTDLMILPASALEYKNTHKKWKGLYAAWPGSGPKGETCGSCHFMQHIVHANTYRKCGLVSDRWTGGAATDVKARAPACVKWRKKG